MKRIPRRPIRATPATQSSRAIALGERDEMLCKAKAFATFAVVALAAAVLAAGAVAQPAAPDSGPGWTGSSHADDVIAARRALMLELQTLMMPIDSHAAGEEADPAALRAAARTIAAMLGTVPHLFPPTTDRFDESAESPVTLALPVIWHDFPGFYSLASAATAAAAKMADTDAPAELPAASRALRGACDACHSVYMREYAAPEVSSEDLEFDFDSLFEPPLE